MKNNLGYKARILFIDDDELNAKAFATRLERRDFSVRLLTSGESALSILETEKYDIILLDIVMPDMDGISLLKKIRSKYSSEELPVIMVTVIADSTDIYEAFEFGANDYITKPLNIDAAAARIGGQLSATKLHQANVKLREIEAISALVITYHHELNNPLAILKSEIQSILEKGKESGLAETQQVNKINSALARITSTLEKIKEVADKNEVEFDKYAKNSKMVKINK